MKTDYRIARGTKLYNAETKLFENINFDDYDLVIEAGQKSYGRQEYNVLKNTTDLSNDEIADICDPNNFGYSRCGDRFSIYID